MNTWLKLLRLNMTISYKLLAQALEDQHEQTFSIRDIKNLHINTLLKLLRLNMNKPSESIIGSSS